MHKHDLSFHLFIAFKCFLISFENVPFYEQCHYKQPLSDLLLWCLLWPLRYYQLVSQPRCNTGYKGDRELDNAREPTRHQSGLGPWGNFRPSYKDLLRSRMGGSLGNMAPFLECTQERLCMVLWLDLVFYRLPSLSLTSLLLWGSSIEHSESFSGHIQSPKEAGHPTIPRSLLDMLNQALPFSWGHHPKSCVTLVLSGSPEGEPVFNFTGYSL